MAGAERVLALTAHGEEGVKTAVKGINPEGSLQLHADAEQDAA